MTTATTRNAPILSDLRAFFTPAEYDADPPADGDGKDDDADDKGTDPPEDGSGSPDATAIRDPEKKRLSDEAAAHRVRAKKAEEALTTATATIQELRLHNAFMRAALPLVDDLDAAWKLCDHSLVKVDDEGNVAGMDTMITAALRAYPYLERVADTVPLPVSGGAPANGRRGNPNSGNAAFLEKKYPALRRR